MSSSDTNATNSNHNDVGLPSIIELNVGGVFYTTSLTTITKDVDSHLHDLFAGKAKAPIRDSKGKFFLDRDGVLFRYVLDFLRNEKLVLPENFHEKDRLRSEAEFFRLASMVECIDKAVIIHAHAMLSHPHAVRASHAVATRGAVYSNSPSSAAAAASARSTYITVGYRGTFAFGRDGMADVKFRKLSRILVCGRVRPCKDVFGDTLNENRDPDRGPGHTDRYTSRFFLKHNFLEQAFDMLSDSGFTCVGSCASGATGFHGPADGMNKASGQDTEESKWNHYNEFVFCRPF
ncbi:PREDICTED: BTB/POZ domain-containing protein KCTD12-like [Priapulus caudatus]|uniref:BTB/POZ domain-containing protein KCTD12-like n=1 Tax=Priapulus caudatus TaxID=37621 RepID=A0ABM1EMF0_PRICU|nr:PREDICTED: BTB/POZ domain-containing protein KCTD12-like [Priapulus caudatus]